MISEWINWFNFLNPANHGDVIVIYPAEMGINRIPLWGSDEIYPQFSGPEFAAGLVRID
jgi:hypothetical protein